MRLAGVAQRSRGDALGRNIMDEICIRMSAQEINAVDEILQIFQLSPKNWVSAARLFRRIIKCALLLVRRERVVEIIKQSSTREDEVPAFATVRKVIRAGEAC